MKLIAHRGNTNGRIPERENKPDYIDEALSYGFDVEIDVWVENSKIFLGHDYPETEINIQFLIKRQDKLWCHAKNLHALELLLDHKLHTFFHDSDEYTITSKGFIWAHPNSKFSSRTICVMGVPTRECFGLCSDNLRNIIYSN